MRKDTKEDPIIGREVIALRDIEDWRGDIIKKGTICTIIRAFSDGGYGIRSDKGVSIIWFKNCITDNFKLTITHYECIKDNKILLSSDEEIEVESIEEFKKNAHKLIVCDEIKITYKAEQR